MYGIRILGESDLWIGPFWKRDNASYEQEMVFRDSEVVKVTYDPIKTIRMMRKRNVKKE